MPAMRCSSGEIDSTSSSLKQIVVDARAGSLYGQRSSPLDEGGSS
jgi:hypothetical protein